MLNFHRFISLTVSLYLLRYLMLKRNCYYSSFSYVVLLYFFEFLLWKGVIDFYCSLQLCSIYWVNLGWLACLCFQYSLSKLPFNLYDLWFSSFFTRIFVFLIFMKIYLISILVWMFWWIITVSIQPFYLFAFFLKCLY